MLQIKMHRGRGGGPAWGQQNPWSGYGYNGPPPPGWGGGPPGWAGPGGPGWGGGPGFGPRGPWMGPRMGGPGPAAFGNWNQEFPPLGGPPGEVEAPPGEEAVPVPGQEPGIPGEEGGAGAPAPVQGFDQDQIVEGYGGGMWGGYEEGYGEGYGGGAPPGFGGPGFGGAGYGAGAWGGNAGYGYQGFNNQGKKKNKNKNKEAATPVKPTEAAKPPANTSPNVTPSKKVEEVKSLNPEDWPPALKAYVSRCFEQCMTDVDKDQVQIILKGKITAAASSNTLWTKNWEEEALPSTLSSKLSSHLGDTSSRGKVFRGGARGRGALLARTGRKDIFNKKDNDVKQPDFGRNPNMVPIGKGGKREKVPYFYTNPLQMELEGDIGGSAKKMKRAARFAGESPPPARRKTLNLASLNDKLLKTDESWEDRDGIDWEQMHIVGTCTKLEKQFLRLTEAPEAHKVGSCWANSLEAHLYEKSIFFYLILKSCYHLF